MSPNQPIPVEISEIPQIVDSLRDYFNTDVTKTYKWRIQQLNGLLKCLKENKELWIKAMNDDMGSHVFEATLLVSCSMSEIKLNIKNLASWMKDEPCPTPLALQLGSTKIMYEPFGVVCNFTPYNYPVFLGFSTLLPILAAGNCCLFKPSSNTPACGYLYQTLLPKYLDDKAVRVVCGPTSICDEILKCRFDFIFYTGSPRVGKLVMAAASKHLTPVLLELGGKSPVYIHSDCSLATTCKRLVLGKVFNGGQTCVAPDYALVHKDIFDKFKEQIIVTVNNMYGDVSKYNDNITHIISERSYKRLVNLIETSGGDVFIKGLQDPEKLYIGPTFISSPNIDSEIMSDEIFGPILPILKVENEDEAIRFIRAREKPLALYVFTESSAIERMFRERTTSGACMTNEVVLHVVSPEAPFGGVGCSGMGKYHGEAGFRSLSNCKPCISRSSMFDLGARFPPYSERWLPFLTSFA